MHSNIQILSANFGRQNTVAMSASETKFLWLLIDPKAELFYNLWLAYQNYGCFSAKPKNCSEKNLRLKIPIYGFFSAKPEKPREN